jgi:8-oxo-dGTP pyrophosphatase MutT (NUDIX family)
LATFYWFFRRPVTLGVRVLMIRDSQVLLVRHTYQNAWYLPGGGVKRSETLEQAVRREASEECGAQLGIYTDFVDFKNDHIGLFLTREFSLQDRRNLEISQVAFFSCNELPRDINPGSRRRIEAFINESSGPIGMW